MNDEDRPGRGVATRDDRVGKLVGDDGHQEPEGADQPDRPGERRIDLGLELGDPSGHGDGHDRDDEQPRDVEADLEAEDPRDGDAVHGAIPGRAARSDSCAADAGSRLARLARRPALSARRPAMTTIATPSTIVVSDQKSNGKSWTR